MEYSKNQINKLGDRLKTGELCDEDRELLEKFRRSFDEPFELVISKIFEQGYNATERRHKTLMSIVEKLKREETRLSSMRDIAGCRIIATGLRDQNEIVEVLLKSFSKAKPIDRREKPRFGYRAVHVIVNEMGQSIEIQVRTELQHLWAEYSEKLSDVIDPMVKHGGGPKDLRKHLDEISKAVSSVDEMNETIFEKHAELAPTYLTFKLLPKEINKLSDDELSPYFKKHLLIGIEESSRDSTISMSKLEETGARIIEIEREMRHYLRMAISHLAESFEQQ